MKHMHRPDFNRPPEMQDTRMVVILPEGLYQGWLDARAANSSDFMKQSRPTGCWQRRSLSYRKRVRRRRCS